MKYRRLDVNGDMSFGAGVSNFLINSPEAVAQAVMTRLKLFQGEWFIDTEIGVPYNTKVLGFGNIHKLRFYYQTTNIRYAGRFCNSQLLKLHR